MCTDGVDALLSFYIHRTESVPRQQLSQSTVLFIHERIYSSPLATIRRENLELQDSRDWAVLSEAIGNAMLEK
jgi:hypothetical protein